EFVNDVDSSNTIEGKPIIYWINKQDQKVPEDAAVVVLANCKNITVENLNVSKNPVSIILVSTVNSKVTNNSVEATDYVIFVHNSSGNIIADNVVSKGGIGIFLHYSTQNELLGNTVTDASNGITLEASEENIIDGNIILECKWGIGLGGSNGNTVRKNVVKNCESLALTIWDNSSQNMFYLNTFINNTRNVQEPSKWFPVLPSNIWDNGTVGNYWSNYNGTDNNGDGIGDTPYIIDEDNQDNYPLTEPYAIPEYPSLMPMVVMLVAVIAVAVTYRRKLSKNNQQAVT
ncbi:MAG: NosD domain-containing protein, partial [Candidatus Bathyarchaeota archaeon]